MGKTETPLSPRRPLVGAAAGRDATAAAAAAGEDGAGTTSAPEGAGNVNGTDAPGAGAALKRRFFFGTETMRSLASLSPPPTEASTLPGSPSEPEPESSSGPPLARSASRGGNAGGNRNSGKGWAETVSGSKGELPSLLAPVELHARDGEGVAHQVCFLFRFPFVL